MSNIQPYKPPKLINVGHSWIVPADWQAKITLVNPDPSEEDQEFVLQPGDEFFFNQIDSVYRLFVRLPNGIEATYQLIAGNFYLATQTLEYLVTQDEKLIIIQQ